MRSDWQWFLDFENEAERRGDAERGRLLQIHIEALDMPERDPDRTLAMLREGRQLAEMLDEPWWVLLFEQWHVHGTIHYQKDFRNLMDAAMRNVLKVRKPLYARYPQRLWIYNDLLTVCLCTDPLGYAERIREGMAYVEGEIQPGMTDSEYLLHDRKVCFALEQRRRLEAQQFAFGALARLDEDSDQDVAGHYRIHIHLLLCLIAYGDRNWAELRSWSLVAEESARQGTEYRHALALALMWRAVAARQAGERSEAARLCRSARTRMERLGTPPDSDYFDAWAGYHELAGNSPQTLRVREQEIETLRDKGRLAQECAVLIECCRLRALMGELRPENVHAADTAAQKLRKPDRYLADLDKALSGEKPEEL